MFKPALSPKSVLTAVQKRLGKPRFLLLVIACLLSFQQIYLGMMELRKTAKPSLKTSLSALGKDMPVLKAAWQHEHFDLISRYEVWDLSASTSKASKSLGIGKENEQALSFAQKKFNGVSALYLTTNESYRWELYGIYNERGARQAVFFNPALIKENNRGWSRSIPGKQLDQNLVLGEIKDDSVIVYFDKEQRFFQLELFSIGPLSHGKPKEKK